MNCLDWICSDGGRGPRSWRDCAVLCSAAGRRLEATSEPGGTGGCCYSVFRTADRTEALYVWYAVLELPPSISSRSRLGRVLGSAPFGVGRIPYLMASMEPCPTRALTNYSVSSPRLAPADCSKSLVLLLPFVFGKLLAFGSRNGDWQLRGFDRPVDWSAMYRYGIQTRVERSSASVEAGRG